MVANLTTPLIGIVSTIAIGRLGDATLLGGVAIASFIFECLIWLFAFLRMSTVAFAAQALGAGEMLELRAVFVRGLVVAALTGAGLIVLQIPLATLLLDTMGGSEGVTRAARTVLHHPDMVGAAGARQLCRARLADRTGARQARAGVQIAINLINMAATMLLVLVAKRRHRRRGERHGDRGGRRPRCSACASRAASQAGNPPSPARRCSNGTS